MCFTTPVKHLFDTVLKKSVHPKLYFRVYCRGLGFNCKRQVCLINWWSIWSQSCFGVKATDQIWEVAGQGYGTSTVKKAKAISVPSQDDVVTFLSAHKAHFPKGCIELDRANWTYDREIVRWLSGKHCYIHMQFLKLLCGTESLICFVDFCRLTLRCGTKHCSSVHGRKANAQVGVVLKYEGMCLWSSRRMNDFRVLVLDC